MKIENYPAREVIRLARSVAEHYGDNVQHKDCMTRVNLGKATVYFEHKVTKRVLRHFAG